MTSDPLRLTVVYERAEHGWTTGTILAVPGTISSGRNRREARDNVLYALREMFAARSTCGKARRARTSA